MLFPPVPPFCFEKQSLLHHHRHHRCRQVTIFDIFCNSHFILLFHSHKVDKDWIKGMSAGIIPEYPPIFGKMFFLLTTQVIIKCGGMKNQDSQPTKLDNLWQCRGDLQESSKDEQSKRQAPYQGPHTPHRPPDPHPPWTHDLSSFTFHSISPSQDAHIPQTSSRFRDHPP